MLKSDGYIGNVFKLYNSYFILISWNNIYFIWYIESIESMYLWSCLYGLYTK